MTKRRQSTRTVAPTLVPIDSTYSLRRVLAAITLIVCASIVYYPSLKVPFLLDDYGKIIRNPDIKSLANIPSRLIYPYETPPEFHRNDPSRPLTYLTLTLNYHFNQLEPAGYHIVNIALHILVVLLIFVLGALVFSAVGINGVAPPFLAALLFAVHPLNINVVTYVIGRAASLASVFYLSAVILFLKARRGAKWGLAASAACFVLALASNQLALTLPAMIFLTDFCFFSEGHLRPVLRSWKQHAIYWGLAGTYLGLRFVYFGKLGDLEATMITVDRAHYVLTEWVVLWKYVFMSVVPLGLSFEHLYGPLMHATDPRILAATVFYGILLMGLLRGLKSTSRSARFILFGASWFLIAILPTSSFFPTTATMAENRTYLPSVGICLMGVLIGYSFIRRIISERFREMVLIVMLGCYSLFLGSLTLRRNILYQDPMALWKDVIRRYPDHERAHQNLAVEYFKQGRFNEMAGECEKVLTLDAGNLDVRTNLASAYYNLGRYNEALMTYREIVKGNPDFAPAYANMGLVYEQLKQVDEAMAAYKNAIRLNPTLIEPLNNLGGLYLDKGLRREAAAMYQAALRIDPNNAGIRKNLERVAAEQSKP